MGTRFDMNLRKLPVGLLIALGLVIALVVVGVGYYNSFVTKENDVEGQWQQVEVQYQRRFDLIPNLVQAAKGAQIQEQKIFGDIAEARTRYAQGSNPEERVAAANDLESGLGRLLAVFENYPQISSNENILRLQDELAGTENRISVERRRYNDIVRSYNTSVSRFPGVLFAGIFGHDKKTYFESDVAAADAPRVSFEDDDDTTKETGTGDDGAAPDADTEAPATPNAPASADEG